MGNEIADGRAISRSIVWTSRLYSSHVISLRSRSILVSLSPIGSNRILITIIVRISDCTSIIFSSFSRSSPCNIYIKTQDTQSTKDHAPRNAFDSHFKRHALMLQKATRRGRGYHTKRALQCHSYVRMLPFPTPTSCPVISKLTNKPEAS